MVSIVTFRCCCCLYTVKVTFPHVQCHKYIFYTGFRAHLNSRHHAWGWAEHYVIAVVMATIVGYFRKYLAGHASSQEVSSACFAIFVHERSYNRRTSKQITLLLTMDTDVLVQTEGWKNTKEAVANFRRLLLCSKW